MHINDVKKHINFSFDLLVDHLSVLLNFPKSVFTSSNDQVSLVNENSHHQNEMNALIIPKSFPSYHVASPFR